MGMLNSVGLQNPGVDDFVANELPELRRHDLCVIANISGNTPEEYAVMSGKLSEAGVDMIITNGAHAEVLYDIVEGKPVGTRFVGRKA